jgi:hypothetical protein
MAWKRLAEGGEPGLGLGSGLGLMRAVGLGDSRGTGLDAGEGAACHARATVGQTDTHRATVIGFDILIRQALTDYPPKRLRTTK